MRASIINAAGRGSKTDDGISRRGIFPSRWGNVPIRWVRMPISLGVENGDPDLRRWQGNCSGEIGLKKLEGMGADMPDGK
jgi:hypothetical protein